MILVPSLQVDECVSFRFHAPKLDQARCIFMFFKKEREKTTSWTVIELNT